MVEGDTAPCPAGQSRYGDLVLSDDGECVFTERLWRMVAVVLVFLHVVAFVGWVRLIKRASENPKKWKKRLRMASTATVGTFLEGLRWTLLALTQDGQKLVVGRAFSSTLLRFFAVGLFWITVWFFLSDLTDFLLVQIHSLISQTSKGEKIVAARSTLQVIEIKKRIVKRVKMKHLWVSFAASILAQNLLNLVVLCGKEMVIKIRVWIVVSQICICILAAILVWFIFSKMAKSLESAIKTAEDVHCRITSFLQRTSAEEEVKTMKKFRFSMLILPIVSYFCIACVIISTIVLYEAFGMAIMMQSYHVFTSFVVVCLYISFWLLLIPKAKSHGSSYSSTKVSPSPPSTNVSSHMTKVKEVTGTGGPQ